MRQSVMLKTLIWEGRASLAVLDTTAVVNEAIRRHGFSPVAAAAFGRACTATAYLCGWLKQETSAISVVLDGNGAGGKICIAGDGALNLRGFVGEPSLDLPPRADGKLDVGGFVGREGTLSVTRDDGDGLPFTGASALVSGEIAEDFSAYFLTSEQRPTAIALGVKIGTDGKCVGAGGVMIQPLPNAGEEILRRAEEEIGRFSSVSSLIERGSAEETLRMVTSEPFEAREVRFRCLCSRKKAASALLSLGRDGAHEALDEDGEISVHCHFCNTDYRFDRAQVRAIFKEEE